ncbi:MAG: enoyl-CoA hydratase/isomerase family protein [Actinobacteria bacterium]|nr:enoyl-CoA hydratase/isomerase family protein [Actinomycetota bacterium]
MDDVEGLRRRVTDGALWLRIDRPEAGNAFTTAVQRGLVEALDAANRSSEIRVVVLTAAGERHFCTGPDLRDREMAPDPARAVGDASRRLREGSQRVVTALLDCEKPVLCGLNGTAAGGGANLVLASDLVVAAEHATIVALFTRRGLIPDGGAAYLLARHLPRNVVKELILFGGSLSAAEAHRLGLVNRVVPGPDLDATLDEWAHRLAVGPTRAFAASKALLNRAVDDDRAAALALEAALVEQVAGSDDVAEGVAAFLERRDPHFRGR